jgi:hypothetical protein
VSGFDEPPEQRRKRRRIYFALMIPCLTLIVVAWTIVQWFSRPAAIGMSLVAMVLPPIASILANAGRER